MGHKLQRRDEKTTTAAGFGKVADIPRIVCSDRGYHRLASRFLIDRGLGVWNPRTKFVERSGLGLSSESIWGYGKLLVNFLDWAVTNKVDPTQCNYADHIHKGFQADMLAGRWSVKRKPLSEGTVNARVGVACQYLSWLTDKSLRVRPFTIPTRTVKFRTGDPLRGGPEVVRNVEKRVGSLRVTKNELHLPSPAEVRTWMKSVQERKGLTFELMCETALLSGMREAAITGLREDTLPLDPREWNIGNESAPRDRQEVLISTRFGVKGPDVGERDSGDKVGYKHTLRIPLKLAERWHHYRNTERQAALKKWVSAAGTRRERQARIERTVHLFLHPLDGSPITQDQFYRAWKNDKVVLPFPQWTVHMARDWWACMTLLQELRKLEILKKLGRNTAAKLLADAAMPVIDLRIRPQLNHLSVETTRIYLRWAANLMATPLSLEWDNALETVLAEPA